MRVVLITGNSPPQGRGISQACGGEDYTLRLAEALRQVGVEVYIVAVGKRNLLHTRSLVQEVLSVRPEAVHLQYPTTGQGKSLVPHTMAMMTANKVPTFITLHEFSQTHLLRQVSCLPFALRSRTIVFTTEHERQVFSTWFPWTKENSVVIPIGSNIPLSTKVQVRDPLGVFYFGLMRPQKGLEEFVKLVKLARDRNRPYRFVIIGAPLPKYASYYETFRRNTNGLPITWEIDLSAEQVAIRLSSLRFAYMPFPDGASERRASLLAALGNGAVVITTRGLQTTDKLSAVVRFASNPSQALNLLDRLTSDVERTNILSLQGREYARQFSWRDVAQAHRQLYEQAPR